MDPNRLAPQPPPSPAAVTGQYDALLAEVRQLQALGFDVPADVQAHAARAAAFRPGKPSWENLLRIRNLRNLTVLPYFVFPPFWFFISVLHGYKQFCQGSQWMPGNTKIFLHQTLLPFLPFGRTHSPPPFGAGGAPTSDLRSFPAPAPIHCKSSRSAAGWPRRCGRSCHATTPSSPTSDRPVWGSLS